MNEAMTALLKVDSFTTRFGAYDKACFAKIKFIGRIFTNLVKYQRPSGRINHAFRAIVTINEGCTIVAKLVEQA